jgi:hypothetical protein
MVLEEVAVAVMAVPLALVALEAEETEEALFTGCSSTVHQALHTPRLFRQ